MDSDEESGKFARRHSPGSGQACRVLVVDDHEDARTLLSYLLHVLGYDVRVAADATAALALVEAFPPDVALLDIGLPGMNGYELAAALRQTSDWWRSAASRAACTARPRARRSTPI
jgi:CheY-like chemotaxis protein